MFRIERYISDLLLENDCISIPGLGGLVAQHFRSEINPGTNIMRPPSKRISFHEELTANAHLLVTNISDGEKISLAETNQLIDKTVKDWQMSLAEGESIKLDGIGRFYQDKQGAVCFNQSLEANFDLNAFGLDMFRATAIKRDVQIKGAVATAIQEHVAPKENKDKKKAFPYWQAAAVFAGIGALLTVGFFKTEVNLNDSFVADFNPLHFSRAIEFPIASEKTLPEASETESSEAPENVAYEDVVIESTPIESSEPESGFEEITNEVSDVLPFQVIVGSFNDINNARDLILNLQRMGYDPQIIEDNSAFTKVSIQGFASRPEAASALRNYKTRVNKGAWIYTAK